MVHLHISKVNDVSCTEISLETYLLECGVKLVMGWVMTSGFTIFCSYLPVLLGGAAVESKLCFFPCSGGAGFAAASSQISPLSLRAREFPIFPPT
jgi:hypothetical protein